MGDEVEGQLAGHTIDRADRVRPGDRLLVRGQTLAQRGEVVGGLEPECRVDEDQLDVGVGELGGAEVGEGVSGEDDAYQVRSEPIGRLDGEDVLGPGPSGGGSRVLRVPLPRGSVSPSR